MPVRYQPPYDVKTYIRGFAVYFDTTGLSYLSNVWTALVVPYGRGVRNTTIGAWRKRWKRWGSRGVSGSRATFSEMDSPFVRCWEGNACQRRLAGFLADVRR